MVRMNENRKTTGVKHFHRSPRAFTLIELLVVVAIIALLVAILVPALNEARDLAKEVVCLANVRSMAMALLYYAEDNEQSLPPRRNSTYTNWWVEDLLPYLAVGSFICPSSTGRNTWGEVAVVSGKISWHEKALDYAYNFAAFGWVMDGTDVYGVVPKLNREWFHSNGQRMPKHSTFVFGEGRLRKDQGFKSYLEPGEYLYESGVFGPWGAGMDASEMTQRHRGGANNAFADGHASFVHYDELRQHGEYWGPDTNYKEYTPGFGPYTPDYE